MEKLDTQIETKMPAESLYGFFKNNMPRFVHMFPRNIQSVQIQGGGDVRAGCVMFWKYDLGITGAPMTARVKVEEIDDQNKSITMSVLEGDVLKIYKSFKAKISFIEGEYGTSKVNWSLSYEKLNDNAPDPDHYVNFATKLSKGMNTYLRSA